MQPGSGAQPRDPGCIQAASEYPPDLPSVGARLRPAEVAIHILTLNAMNAGY
jgi:hypothetical protein